MPTYTYICGDCKKNFELFFYIKDYNPQPQCTNCQSHNTDRSYIDDVITQSASVKKADSELKTIGDLAMRNTERMSDDEKAALYMKHNAYKEEKFESKPLPQGMSYKKKQPKPIWPGSQKRKRRSKNNG